MKLLIENWRKYINEIGDASAESYPFELLDPGWGSSSMRNVGYNFNSENYLYSVNFQGFFGATKEESNWIIDFDAVHRVYPVTGTKEMTGEGRPLQIMSTIVKIIKDFVGNPQLNEGILNFRFTGISKSGVQDHYSGKETQRTRLYKIFLEKNMPPGTEVKEIGNNVIAFTVPGGDK